MLYDVVCLKFATICRLSGDMLRIRIIIARLWSCSPWLDWYPYRSCCYVGTRLCVLRPGASKPPLWMGDQPPHLTWWSTIHLVWAEHGGMILLFGPVWFGYCIMRLSESPQYWAMCCLHKNGVTLASNNLFTIGINGLPNATTNNSLSNICNRKFAIRQPSTFKNVWDCSPTPLG